MKKLILIILGLCLTGIVLAQNLDDLIFQIQSDTLRNDIIKVNFQKKDARRAMLYSMIFPGAGQFYADKSAFTAYMFPVLEAAMIGGILYFDHRGDKKTDDFEYYATGEDITQTFHYTVDNEDYSYTYTGKRYRREYQSSVETVLKNINAFDIYDDSFFRLDDDNSQHFYEDIGKYNKYIFGWTDWYHRFATDPTSEDGAFILDNPDYEGAWIFSGSVDPQLVYKRRWEQNYTVEDFMNGIIINPISPSSPLASPLRREYIAMRKAANREYTYSRYFMLGLAMNHLSSAVEAVFRTNKVNRTAITANDVKFYYCTDYRDDRLTPMVGLRYSF